MKKRTAFIGAILSLIPLGQPLLIKTGVVLSSSAVMLSLSEKVNAKSADFYFDSAYYKAEKGDEDVDIDDLYIKTVFVDQGPSIRRFRPRARGMANRIHKKTSHLTVILESE